MPGLRAINPKEATGKTKELLDVVQAKLKITPNMTRVMANSPAVLESYLAFSAALHGGSLDGKLREQIALVVAQANRCEYCLSAHTAIGKMVGLTDADIEAGRKGTSTNPKNAAACFSS
jgi:AhpD family alkylhydroperoxidase